MLPRIVLAIYWVGLFVATHLPPGTGPAVPPSLSDKHLHTISYAVLACLLALAWFARERLSARSAARLLAVIVAYGVIEELTQIPFGRTADVSDLAADLIGAVLGLAVYQWGVARRKR